MLRIDTGPILFIYARMYTIRMRLVFIFFWVSILCSKYYTFFMLCLCSASRSIMSKPFCCCLKAFEDDFFLFLDFLLAVWTDDKNVATFSAIHSAIVNLSIYPLDNSILSTTEDTLSIWKQFLYSTDRFHH